MRSQRMLMVLGFTLLSGMMLAACGGGESVTPACDDALWNGEETDLDCGGECNPCAAGGGCLVEADCMSSVCTDGKCIGASCSDGLRNGYETDVDCGGNCNACLEGDHCLVGNNCDSGVCVQNVCVAPTCDDGVQNGDELGPDCGIECGPCPAGYPCSGYQGCLSESCVAGLCAEPACDDGVLNGSESDYDCGGSACEPCAAGDVCLVGGDCQSGVCVEGLCQLSTCDDGVQNGEELGVDCAGGCEGCPGGTACVLDTHCMSLQCTDGICEAPTCGDLLLNGDETDVDCGGSCPPCQFNEDCMLYSDCATGICGENGRCSYGEHCAHILSASPGAPDGLYLIDPEQDGYLPLWAWCDMTTDRGGWTLVLNYLHVGGTNPQLYNSPDSLPWRVSSLLGDDEQGTYSWRHTQNELFAKLAVEEMRFEGSTSAHERRMHFKTDLPGCIDYFATGTGSCAGIQKRYLPLAGHDSLLPDWADTFNSDRANQAMTDFTFCAAEALGQEACWAVRGGEDQWSLDHIRAGSGFDTLHRIYVRAKPTHCTDNSQDYSETDLDCGGLCTPCGDGASCNEDGDCFGLCLAGTCMTPPNCTEILVYRSDAEDGIYGIDPDGSGPYSPMQAYCDMTTDGGGWTLVLNYLHQADTDPAIALFIDALPQLDSGRMGKDDSGSDSWGHVDQALFAALNPADVRFYAKTSAHERLTNFSTDSTDCIAYLSGDETKSCGDMTWQHHLLDGHDARLPAAMDGAAQLGAGLESVVMTSQPFYANNLATWNIGFGDWNVDEWRGGISQNTHHRIFVRSVPSHCSDGERSGDETDVDCGGSCARCGVDQTCAIHAQCATGLCSDGVCALSTDCSQIHFNDTTAPSGNYLVDIDGEGDLAPMTVSCDMQTDGGGWMLALNYLHRGGTSPALASLTDRLPLRGADTLGPDESGSERWGNASNAMFALLDVDEMRFDGKSSAHDRVTNFVTADTDCIAYFGTGTGHDCSGVVVNHRILPGHTAMLPAAADMHTVDSGEAAMTIHPFWAGWHFHWIMLPARWETDDYVGNNSAYTMHRTWVRAEPEHCESGEPDGDEEGTDCGGSCTTECATVALGEPCSLHKHCVTGFCNINSCQAATNCTELLEINPETKSGNYLIDPDGPGGIPLFFASCDMTTDGGGWTLVVNYLHQGGTDPAVLLRENDLPLRGSNIFGTDESASGFWGHASNAIMAALNPAEVRFDGISYGVHRYIHFSTSLVSCVDYVTSGLGTFDGMQSYHRLLAGHSAHTPAAATSFYTDQGDEALVAFPFYLGGTYHWGIWQTGTGIGRWEVDDSAGGPGQHTRHRVWLRSAVTLLHDDFQDLDMAGWTVYDETSRSGPSEWSVRADGWLMETSNINEILDGWFLGSILFWDDVAAKAWDDYRMSVRFYNSDNDGVGVVFRYTDEQNFYRLNLCNDNAHCDFSRLTKVVDGVESEIARVAGDGFIEDRATPLDVWVEGNRIRIWVNGRERFDVYDDAHPQGTVGLFSWGSTTVYYDEVRVMEVP